LIFTEEAEDYFCDALTSLDRSVLARGCVGVGVGFSLEGWMAIEGTVGLSTGFVIST
jgi:hypothetical protein